MRVRFNCGPKRKPHREDPIARNAHNPTACGFVFTHGETYGPTLVRSAANEDAKRSRVRGGGTRIKLHEVELTPELLDQINEELRDRYTDAQGPMFEWSFEEVADDPAKAVLPKPWERDDSSAKSAGKAAAAAAKTAATADSGSSSKK